MIQSHSKREIILTGLDMELNTEIIAYLILQKNLYPGLHTEQRSLQA